MIGKVIGGRSFAGTVGYVMKQDAVILDAEGIAPPHVRDMVRDFMDQALLDPRVKNVVGHISLSFSEQDGAKLSDGFMADIAREYMRRMGIENTQYLIVRHHDAPHTHCHIVYNRVRNDGTTVPDSNIWLRNVRVCRELTERHGLYIASGKENVREHRLREPDRTKYEIYNAIRTSLPNCRSWDELERKLARQGIGMELIRNGSSDQIQGVKFSKNNFHFSGSKIDRMFSYSKIDRVIGQAQTQGQRSAADMNKTGTNRYSPQSRHNLLAATERYMSAFAKCFPATFSGSDASGGREINLSTFGVGSLPLPPTDSGIGISAAQLQRQPGETQEQHIARITALVKSVTAAMIAHAEEQKRRQQQIKKPKIRL
jgi:hypothetical protein